MNLHHMLPLDHEQIKGVKVFIYHWSLVYIHEKWDPDPSGSVIQNLKSLRLMTILLYE